MALGFGFNKQKVLASAEKAVQQGKLQNAISDYEKVVKEDPKDLTVLNTIGDLYARVGNNERASGYFKKVGDIYAAEGFTVKAIAVYKKIAKLNPNAIDCVIRLAELYTQQGLYNDARAQYVVVADHAMKTGNLEEAARIFQKILELDSENTAMQAKLADLYIKLGRKDDARNIFLTASQALYARGALDAADESLRRVISLDPNNLDALLLRGKIAADAGDSASAVLYLEKIPDLDSRPEALRALLVAKLQLGKNAEAEPLARKLLTVHNDFSGMTTYAETLLAAGALEDALKVYEEYSDRLLAANSATVIEKLASHINRISEDPAALELLRGIFSRAGEHSRVNEVSELLAHACVQCGDLKKAGEIYKELSTLEPENPLHLQNYKQIQAKLGQDPTVREISKEEGAQALMVDELELQAPVLEANYSADLRDAVKAALTEAELFESYSMPTKAIMPLEAVLRRAPRDAQVNQRLASLYSRSGRVEEAVKCCEVLQEVYSEAGHTAQSKKYAEMAARYKERTSAAAKVASVEYDASFLPGGDIPTPKPYAAPAPPPALSTRTPTFTPAPSGKSGVEEFVVDAAEATEEAAAPPEFSLETSPQEPVPQNVAEAPGVAATTSADAHEIDLTEWENMTSVEEPQPEVTSTDLAEEVKFYLSQSMWKEAGDAISKLEAQSPDAPQLAGFRQQLAAAKAPAEAAPAEATVAEFSFDMRGPEPVVTAPAPPPLAPAPSPAVPAPAKKPAAAEKPAAKKKDVLADFALDLDESLGEDFAIPTSPPPASASKAASMSAASASTPATLPAPSKTAPARPVAASPRTFADPEASSALSDMFAEFKEELEETSDEGEDPDTHYNLGVAFKEMGLLDEAIGELQKVCHAIERGHPFTQVMQAYTWLAHCFLEKGAPEASVKWYEKALHVDSIGEESKLAVYYELGSAYEAAGNKRAALQNFNEVYSNNIDYRDVAERIKALKS